MESLFNEYTSKGVVKRYRVFDKVENVNDAYFLGYLANDGGFVLNRVKSGTYSFMMVNSKRQALIQAFKDNYCPDQTIYFQGNKSSKKVRAVNDVYELRFPRPMNDMFSRYGIFDYKTERKLVGIPKKYIYTFFAAMIDADGSIVVTARRDCRKDRLRVFITSSAFKLLESIQRYFVEDGISSSILPHGNRKCSRLWIQDQKSVQNLLSRCYSEISLFQDMKKLEIYNQHRF